MPDTLRTVLIDLRDFAFPFVLIGATVFVLIMVIRKFDFFRAGSTILGLNVEAGRHEKTRASRHIGEPQVIDHGSRTPKKVEDVT
jgi:hypothetical protein